MLLLTECVWKLIGHESTLKILEFILNLIEKVKHGFLLSSIEQDKILISQHSPPKFRNFADQDGPKRRPHENDF